MLTADQEPCHRCGHQRKYHDPKKCTFEGCECIGFSKMRVDPATARSEVNKYLVQAVLALRAAFSSDQEIKRELHEAVDRIMQDE
jgi:hypothetical protein